MNRFRALLLGGLCLGLTGCVEGEMTYTVNPNGSARIHFNVVTVAPPNFNVSSGGAIGRKPETPDDMLRKSIRGLLESPNVAAWKDVSAEWTPNGKLKLVATAYVRQLSDFSKQQGSFMLLSPKFALEKAPDGGMKLVRSDDGGGKGDPSKRKPKTPDEIKAMTDEQLDQEILLDLIEMQAAKGLLAAMLTDCKLKTTFVLPGDVTEARGFTRDGGKASYTLDGNKVLGDLNKLLASDRPTLRKEYRSATAPDVFKTRVIGELGDGSATVAKPGGALFDFDKEVGEAREAYPALRKKLGLGDDVRLPTGDGPPKK